MFTHKDYVFAIVEAGGFTKAAEKLFVSQPSLSATIKRLETEIGAPIFNRATNPVTLTEVGKTYLEYAWKIREAENDFARYVDDCNRLLTGKIRIGGSSFFSSFILPQIVSAFNEKYPKIAFEILENNTKNLTKKLLNGSLDLVIDNAQVRDENVRAEVYATERLILSVPKKFELNERLYHARITTEEIKSGEALARKEIDYSVFDRQPFILLRQENDTGKRADDFFREYGVNPNVVFYLDQQVTAYNVSCMGTGIAFISDTLIKRTAASPDVYYYPLPEKIATRNIFFYHNKNHYLPLACQKFLEDNVQ